MMQEYTSRYYNLLNTNFFYNTTVVSDSDVEKMLKDPDIKAAVNSRVNGLLSKDWGVRSLTGQEEEAKEIQNRIFNDLEMYKKIKEIDMATFTRREFFEIMWKEDFTIEELKLIDQDLVCYDILKNEWYITDKNGNNIYLTPEKFLKAINEESMKNPYGVSVIEELHKTWTMKKALEDAEMGIVSKYSKSIPYFLFDSSLESSQVQEQADQVANMSNDVGGSAIAIPDYLADVGGTAKDTFGFLTLDSFNVDIHEMILKRLRQTIQQLILGGSASIESSTTGGYAESKTANDVREEIITSDAMFVRDVLQDLIKVDAELYGYDAGEYYFYFENPINEVLILEEEEKKVDIVVKLKESGYVMDVDKVEEKLGYEPGTLTLQATQPTQLEFAKKKNTIEEKQEINLILSDNVAENVDMYSEEVTGDYAAEYRPQITAIKKLDDIDNIAAKIPDSFIKSLQISIMQGMEDVDSINDLFLDVPDINPFKLPNEEAIKFYTDRTPMLIDQLEEINEQVIANSFYIKHSTDLEVTKKLYTSLNNNLIQGGTFKEWKKDLGKVADDLGVKQNGYYLENVYRTNNATAYNSGRWDRQSQTVDTHEYWLYDAIDDGRTSEICLKLDGKIYKSNNPIWNSIYPPNHYGCRSNVIALSKDDMDEEGLKANRVTNEVKELKLGSFNGNPAKYKKSLQKSIDQKEKDIAELKKSVQKKLI